MTYTLTPISVKKADGTPTPMIAYNDGTNSAFAQNLLDATGAVIAPATSGLQTTGNSALASIVTNTTSIATAAGQTTANTSLATIATNTNAIATAAKQDTGNTSLATIATNSTTGNTTLGSILTAVQGATPAGTNLVGKFGIDQTTPGTTNGVQLAAALPAGTNSIGSITRPDPAATTGTITAADAVTTSPASLVSGQTLYTGTPTANSAVVVAVSGFSSFSVQLTGTAVATAQFEKSMDGGTTWVSLALTGIGSTASVSTLTGAGANANALLHGNAANITHVRVRCTAFTSGTWTVRVQPSYGVFAVLASQNGAPWSVAQAGLPVQLTAAPAVTAGAYTSGQVVGGLISLTGATRTSAGGGTIQTVMVTVKTALTAPFDVFFFITNPTNSTFTDNAALVINPADMPFLCGVAQCNTLVSAGTPQILIATNLALPFKLSAANTTLYAVIVMRGAESFASTSAVGLTAIVIQD